MLTVGVDGSALGNPGPAGWAWYIDETSWQAGGWDNSTNNRGELTAILKILEATQDTHHDLTILADSQYAINSITKWMPGWKRKGWKKSNGKPVNNQDLMIRLDELMTAARKAGRTVTFEWVRGHSGHALNEAADSRANAAAKAFQTGKQLSSGPGLNIDEPPAADPTMANGPAQHPEASQTVTVHTYLERHMSDEIVQQARQRNVTPHEELARLIRSGMDALYDTA